MADDKDDVPLGDRLRRNSMLAREQQMTWKVNQKLKELEKILLDKARKGETQLLLHQPLNPDVVNVLEKKHKMTYKMETNKTTGLKEYWIRW